MTTFEDPQPKSRRAVRESQRNDGSNSVGEFSQEPVLPPQFYSGAGTNLSGGDAPAANNVQDATARATAEELFTGGSQGGGRRAANSAVDNESQSAGAAGSEPTRPSYRVRDFRPDSRRSAAFDLERGDQQASQPSSSPGNTVQAGVPVPPSYVIPSPTDGVPVVPPAPALDQPLSRRELRQRQAGLASSPSVVESFSPAPAAQQETPRIDASAAPIGSDVSAPFPLLLPSVERVGATEAPFEASFAEQPTGVTFPTAPVSPAVIHATAAVPAVVEASATAGGSDIGRADASSSALPNSAPPNSAPPNSALWAPPVGHWSTQTGEDAEVTLADNAVNRTIGSGTAATSALVMPSIPLGSDIRGPLTGNGEIMLTGSIDLPHTLSATGQSDRFDDGRMDALFDLNDAEVISTDSSPVRAIRAISTHTSGHGVTHTQKPKGTRALTALLISASAMAVAVAALLVAAFAFNVF